MSPMLYLLLLLSLILCCVAASQNAAFAQTNPPAAVTTTSAPPPLPPSPADTFRSILGMPEAERQKFLGSLSSQKRQIVLLKLDEYRGLPAEQREERLRALQVRVWVPRLIKMPLSNRVERLAGMQPAERQLIEARLAKWDELPQDKQKELFTNELAIRTIISSPEKFNPTLPPFPPDPKVAKELKHWFELTAAHRGDVLARFEYFLEDVNPEQRATIIAQRPGMAKTVAPIASLTKDQRERYLAGLKRFDALTPAERHTFLIRVRHWEKMTPEQRQSWRVLAKKLTPPAAPPPPPTGRPSASVIPAADHAAADIPSR